MDVVIPLIKDTYWGDESIRYTLRSIEENYKDCGKVIIIGHRPSWLDTDKVVWIKHDNQHLKDKIRNFRAYDISCKLSIVVDIREISNPFLYTYDDVCFLKPVHDDEFFQPLAYSERVNPNGSANTAKWRRLLMNTLEMCRKEGYTTYHYETHLPRAFEKRNLKELIEDFNLKRNPYLFSSLYYNKYFGGVPKFLTRDMPSYKASFLHRINEPHIVDALIKGRTFLNYDDQGLTPLLQEKIKSFYPKKSSYER